MTVYFEERHLQKSLAHTFTYKHLVKIKLKFLNFTTIIGSSLTILIVAMTNY